MIDANNRGHIDKIDQSIDCNTFLNKKKFPIKNNNPLLQQERLDNFQTTR